MDVSGGSWDSYWFQTALPLLSLQASTYGTRHGHTSRICDVTCLRVGLLESALEGFDDIEILPWRAARGEGKTCHFPKLAFPQRTGYQVKV